MNLHMCAKFGPDRSSCLGSILHFLICDPLTPSQMPLGVSSPLICLAYVHSQMNLHTCAEFGPAVWHLSYIFEFGSLIPYKCPLMSIQMPLDVSRGYFFLTYIHSEMNLHTYAKFGPDRSSGLESFLDL